MALSNGIENQIVCKVLEFDSPEQLESIELRRLVLRKPLGLDFDSKDLNEEFSEVHIGAFFAGKLIGILLLKKVDIDDNDVLKMRQVAVNPDWQGKGVGHILVGFSERWAIENAYTKIELHARKTAVPFYLKMDYTMTENEFIEVGIPHYKMFKHLNPK